MSERMRAFFVDLFVTFMVYLVVVYLWDRGVISDWSTTLFRGAVIAIAVAAGTTLALSRKQSGRS